MLAPPPPVTPPPPPCWCGQPGTDHATSTPSATDHPYAPADGTESEAHDAW